MILMLLLFFMLLLRYLEYLEQAFALQSLGYGPGCIHSHSVPLQAKRSQTLVLLHLTDQLLH